MAHKTSEDNFFEDNRLSTYTPIPMMAQLKRMWRRTDSYALPVTLRYKGEKKFYTNFGALISCTIYLALMVYLGL